MTRPSLVAALALAGAIFATIPDPATGCAIAPHHGEYVSTTDETALIVWDEKTKTEHFVRRASFHSTGYDFGFLVPTPTHPHLDVASDNLFFELTALTAARAEIHNVVREVDKEFAFGLGCAPQVAMREELAGTEASAPIPRAGNLEVLEQKRVGDYDATVLAFRRGADDTPDHGAAELTKWLAKHGYEASDAIQTWLKQYVSDGWCVTAFKVGTRKTDGPKSINSDPNPHGSRNVRARPIRMSFHTERPFYPYREPAADPTKQPDNEARRLRVFLAAPARYAGTLGDGSKPWPWETVWAGPTDDVRWEGLFQKAKLTGAGKDGSTLTMPNPADEWWLTEFEDRSSPRLGTDEVYFAPSADPSPVTRPLTIATNTRTIVRTPWWHAVVYFGVPAALVFGGLAARRSLRRV